MIEIDTTKRRTRWVLGPMILMIGTAAGCEAMGQDFGEFASGLMPKSPAEAARMAADFNDPDRRREGVVLLSNAPFGGNPPYVALYREYATEDRDPIVRAVSIQALARHGGPEDALLIASGLESTDLTVRWEAAKGLQRLHNPAVVPDMLTVLRNEREDPDIRAEIARGLGQYQEDRVFQALVSALDARELSINMEAAASLKTLTGKDFDLEDAAWLNWYRGATAAGENPFAGHEEYLYPTYTRKASLLEKMAFWNPPVFEQPAPPAGLEPSGTRSTYEDAESERPDA